ncbi:MAG: helix-turn-helix transcriptional regulator [Bacteroidota bacterium]
MSLLTKFIDSLTIRFHRATYWEVTQPIEISSAIENHNYIILLDHGHMVAGKEGHMVRQNSFYFFPAGQPIIAQHGLGVKKRVTPEEFHDEDQRRKYLNPISGLSDLSRHKEVIVSVVFDVLLYDAIPFFEILDLPPFPLESDVEFGHLVRYIALEFEQSKLGRDKIIRNYMEEIIIQMCRYMDSQPGYKKYLERMEYLTDKRLVDIVKYIQENMDKDLSNKVLANVAFVSEDYVGQFFKTLTGRNLQDYIENQRLDKALSLLKTQPDSIQEIAHKVGFKDPAYFSRRFKLRFGENANRSRKA